MRVRPDVSKLVIDAVDRLQIKMAYATAEAAQLRAQNRQPSSWYEPEFQAKLNGTREIYEILAQNSWGIIIETPSDGYVKVRWNFVSDVKPRSFTNRYGWKWEMCETMIRNEYGGVWNLLERPFETIVSIYDVVPDTI